MTGVLGVEVGNGPRFEVHPPSAAVGDEQQQLVLQEIEANLEAASPGGHQRRREAACVHIERHSPPVVDVRPESEARLADDLGPQLDRVPGVAPRIDRQCRPRVVSGFHKGMIPRRVDRTQALHDSTGGTPAEQQVRPTPLSSSR